MRDNVKKVHKVKFNFAVIVFLIRISRGKYNEMKQQTDELDEYKLCEKGVKSVIKKIIEKHRDHKELLEDLRPITH